MSGPIFRQSNGKDYVYGQFDNQAECFIKVKVDLLIVALCKEASLAAIKCTISFILGVVDPFVINDVN